MPDIDRPATAPADAPAPQLRRQRVWLPSLVWLVPTVAAVVGLSLLMKSVVDRGPEITVTFRNADGLTPGRTPVRYKNVDIGLVKTVRLTPDHVQVLATIELTKDAASFSAKDTRFWVVRPRFALTGVTGLETLLSGAYVGVDAGRSDEREHDFIGLDVPPVVTTDASGKQFVLHAVDLGSLDIGSPVYFRRVRVGQVVSYQLDPAGRSVTLRVFVESPYDKFVTADARFWQASGLDFKLDANGFKLTTQSLVSLMLGGIAFQAREDSPATQPAIEATEFVLAGDQGEAMKPADELAPLLAVLNFDQSVRGLAPGAPLDFRGVVVGKVRSIGIEYRSDAKAFQLPVVVELYPSRLGLHNRTQEEERRAQGISRALVARGLRAQLRPGNLLTGQLYVALDYFPKAPPSNVNLDGPLPELPTVPNSLDELPTKLGEIVGRIDKVPFEQIGQQLRAATSSLNVLLGNADELVKQLHGDVAPQVVAALQDARKTLNSANGALAADGPLHQDTRRMLQELTRTAVSLRTLTDYLERHPEALLRGKTENAK